MGKEYYNVTYNIGPTYREILNDGNYDGTYEGGFVITAEDGYDNRYKNKNNTITKKIKTYVEKIEDKYYDLISGKEVFECFGRFDTFEPKITFISNGYRSIHEVYLYLTSLTDEEIEAYLSKFNLIENLIENEAKIQKMTLSEKQETIIKKQEYIRKFRKK